MATQLGRYLLDKRLALGGMAEIYSARCQMGGGVEKRVVVKKILPFLAENETFVRMFLDEARLAAQLSHPNIVQIFDLGKQHNEYFIAMERIDGENLHQIRKMCKKKKTRFPLEYAVHIACQVCDGLQYAHEKCDGQNRPLDIVHRDISPQNVMISLDGDIKLLDFGIAKAAFRSHETKTGNFKGKCSYMSPEQGLGKKMDSRSDLFSLGVLLWELITGSNLFTSDSMPATIMNVVSQPAGPPSRLNPSVPGELDEILLKMLEKDPDGRFQSAQELHQALQKCAHNNGWSSNTLSLRRFVSQVFADASGNSRLPAGPVSPDSPGVRTTKLPVPPLHLPPPLPLPPQPQSVFLSTGRLERRPLPFLIQEISASNYTGTLHLESNDGSAWIYFNQGFPAAVHNEKSQHYLGGVLREMGILGERNFNEIMMELANSRRLLGQILLERKLIDDQQLSHALMTQATRKMVQLFQQKDGEYRFEEGSSPSVLAEPLQINPYWLIRIGIQSHYQIDDIRKWLAQMADQECRISDRFDEHRQWLNLQAEELEDLELLTEYQSLTAFARQAKGSELANNSLLLTLFCCGMLEWEDGAQDAKGQEKSESDGSCSSCFGPGPSSDLVEKINEKYASVLQSDLWRVLEVRKGADAATCRQAYYSLVKQYHPDSFTDLENDELHHFLTVIITRLQEALDILGDSQRTAKYEHELSMAARRQREKLSNEALFHFKKCQVFLKMHDLPKARDAIQCASDLEPEVGDYQATLVWIDHLADEGKDQDAFDCCLQQLKSIARSDIESFCVAKYLWMLSKEMGEQKSYLLYLSRSFRLNPEDIETRREKRLVSLRKKNESKKWFKRCQNES